MTLEEFNSKKQDAGDVWVVTDGDKVYVQPKSPNHPAYPLPKDLESMSYYEVSPNGKVLRIGSLEVR